MESFVAKPVHLVYAVILLAIGTPCLAVDGWQWFGVALWLLAGVVVVWLLIAGVMAERTRYWLSVADVLEAASKNDLDKIAALGFRVDSLPDSVHVDMRKDQTQSYHFDIPVSSVKLVTLANGLMNGRPFAERVWAGEGGLFSADEFRRLRGVMKDRGLIAPINDKDNRQGFQLTDAGRELMSHLLPSPTGENV